MVGWDGAPSYITESDLSLEQLQKFRANPVGLLRCGVLLALGCRWLSRAWHVACAGEGWRRRLAHRHVAAGLCAQAVRRHCEAMRLWGGARGERMHFTCLPRIC